MEGGGRYREKGAAAPGMRRRRRPRGRPVATEPGMQPRAVVKA